MADDNITDQPRGKPSLGIIHNVVAECFGIAPSQLISFKEGPPSEAQPADVAIWLARQSGWSDDEIASHFRFSMQELSDAEERVAVLRATDTDFCENTDYLKSYLLVKRPNPINTFNLVVSAMRLQVDLPHSKKITIDQIQKAAAEHFGLKQADLLSPDRHRSIARPRQAAMWLAKNLTTRSLPDIGRRFGGRDHTTVLHAVRRIEALRVDDPALQLALDQLTRKLRVMTPG